MQTSKWTAYKRQVISLSAEASDLESSTRAPNQIAFCVVAIPAKYKKYPFKREAVQKETEG